MFKTNSTKLADYVDIFPSKLIKEGDDCLCDEGELGNCKRFIWNCQWAYHSQSKGFCAQRNRCVIGSRIVYGVSNQIVIDELAAGLRCSLKSCLRRLLDGHFINNPDGGNTRFCSNICLNAYLKKMKDDAEKVSFITLFIQIIRSRNWINGWDFYHFFQELLLTI
jgi:hypothetical protein